MNPIIHALEVFNDFFVRLAKWVVVACVACQTILVFCTVIFRYFLHHPITWGDEVSALFLVMITFLGCYLALSQNKLARIEIIIGLFRGRAKKVVYILSELLSLAMLLIVLYFGIALFLSPTSMKQRTAGLYIPLSFFYGMIPLTFFAGVIGSVLKIIDLFHAKEGADKC